MKRKIIFICSILVLLWIGMLAAIFLVRSQYTQENFVTIGDARFTVEVADTIPKQVQGLSGRASLCATCGMLFTYAAADVRPFWMKDMKFPLDFVWIRSGKIIDLTRSVPVPRENETPITITPREPVDAILEINAGIIDRFHFVIGDKVY